MLGQFLGSPLKGSGPSWIFASVVMVCLASCSNPPKSLSQGVTAPVSLTIGLPVNTEDPLYGVGQAAGLASLEGLTTQNLNGRPVPRLAEGWSESPDGLTWTIRLRPSAVFHDGSAVDAQAVKSSLEQFLSSDDSRYSPGLQDISSIAASDRFTLTIHLKAASNFLLDNLDTPITKVNATGEKVGTGPYVISSTTATEVVMEAFPKYYRGMPTISRLVWRLYPTVRTAWAGAMRGEVDFLYEVGPESREFFQSEASINLYSFLRNYVYGVVFNAKRPALQDPEVRRALNYAVNRNAIVREAFKGHARTASGPAWPLHWAYDDSVSGYPYDPARAAATLEKARPAGQTGNHAGVTTLRFVCLIPENFQLWERLAMMVQRDLSEVGVDMSLEAVPFGEFNQRIAKGDFDVVLMEMVSGYSVSRPFNFWGSSGLMNFAGYHDPTVDAAFEGTRRAPGDSEYRDAFRRFQQATMDNPPAIFLAWGETARAVNRRFEVVKSPGGDIRMTISDWRLAPHPAGATN